MSRVIGHDGAKILLSWNCEARTGSKYYNNKGTAKKVAKIFQLILGSMSNSSFNPLIGLSTTSFAHSFCLILLFVYLQCIRVNKCKLCILFIKGSKCCFSNGDRIQLFENKGKFLVVFIKKWIKWRGLYNTLKSMCKKVTSNLV